MTLEGALIGAVTTLTGAVGVQWVWFRSQFEKLQAEARADRQQSAAEISRLNTALIACEADKSELWARIGRIEDTIPAIPTTGRRAKRDDGGTP